MIMPIHVSRFIKGFFFSIFLVTQIYAWPVINGVAICTAANHQEVPTIASDGSGGAIITWEDFRNTTANLTQGIDVYAQRVNSQGSTLWTTNGVAICTAKGDQENPTVASDGSGGAIITWTDFRNDTTDQIGHIYAQRVNSSGSTLWTLDGVAISTAFENQFTPLIMSDGSGGAIISYNHYDNGITGDDVFAQRVNSTGSTLWGLNGVAVCTAAYGQFNLTMASDGAGGAIISWSDGRNGIDSDVYAQRVNSTGSTLWTNNGIAVSTATGSQSFPSIVSDGSSGAIITWEDSRSNGSTYAIYAQRVNSTGSTLWTLNGVIICTAFNDQFIPVIASTGSGGALITWYGERDGVSYDIYAQSIDSAGNTLWTPNGVAVCTAAYNQGGPKILSDGSNGAIITWQDYRNGSTYNIYAQRVNSSGSTLWTLNGVAVCTAANNRFFPMMVSDGSGGAIITWEDERNGTNYDIYAQQVNDNGLVPVEDWFDYAGDISLLKRE